MPEGSPAASSEDVVGGRAALAPKPATERVRAALVDAGLYDDDRRLTPYDEDRTALPVVTDATLAAVTAAAPAVERVVEYDLPRRHRTLADHLRDRGWTDAEIDRAPASWAVVGTVVLVEMDDAPRPAEVGEALLALHGEADTVLDRGGIAGRTRDPDPTVVAGIGETETVHTEHGTQYALDLATTMFSPGNKAERARMGEVVASDERVFDMFAGVGYFALPMARAGADVVAAEIDPTAYRYLVENAVLNGVQDRLRAFRADCRDVEVAGVDRVVMGHYDAYERLDAAIRALGPGGRLHLHEATPEAELPDRPVGRLREAAADHDRTVEVEAVREVKSHAEGVLHVVVDAVVA